MTNDAAVAWVVVDQTLRKDSPDPNFMDGAYWTSFETVSADRALSVVKERQSIRPTGKYEVVALVHATTVAELRARVEAAEQKLAEVVEAAIDFLEAADARDNEEVSTQYPDHEKRLSQYKAAREDLNAILPGPTP